MKIIAQAPWYILFCLFALSQSTETVYTTGLPAMAIELHIASSLAQITSSVYFYGFATGIFILGQASDRFGRRPVILFGLSLYITTAVVCIFVTEVKYLIMLRFIQAFGASVGSVVAQAMARDSYRGAELSSLFATLSAGLAFTPAIGSLIGGQIVNFFGWRYNFIFLGVLGCLMLWACYARMPETNAYLGEERKSQFGQVFKVIIRDKSVFCYALIIGCFNGILYSFYVEAPFIFIKQLNIPASLYGFIILSLSIAGICGSMFSRYLVKKGANSQKILVRVFFSSFASCILLFITSIIWYYNTDLNKNWLIIMILVPTLVQGVCYSLVMPIVLRHALENYARVNGTAGSIFGCLYYLIIATINLVTAKIHNDYNIMPVAGLFLCLSILSIIAHFIVKHIEEPSFKPFCDD